RHRVGAGTLGGKTRERHASPTREPWRANEHGSAGRGRRALSSAETQDGNVSECAEPLSSQPSPRGLRGILYNGNSIARRKIADGRDVGGISIEMRHDDGINTSRHGFAQ